MAAAGAGAACQSLFKVHEISMSIDCSRGGCRRWRRVLMTPLTDASASLLIRLLASPSVLQTGLTLVKKK